MIFKICFRHLVLLEMISFEKIFKHCKSVGGINTLVVDVIGQRSRDVIGGLSVEPSCHWL